MVGYLDLRDLSPASGMGIGDLGPWGLREYLGFRVLGFRVWGVRFRFEGLASRVLGFGVSFGGNKLKP